MEHAARGVVEIEAIEVGVILVGVSDIGGRGERGDEAVPESGAEQERVDEAAFGGGFASEIPASGSGDESGVETAMWSEGQSGIGFGEEIEGGGDVVERAIEGLPAEAGSSADEDAAFEEAVDPRGVGGGSRGEQFDELGERHVAQDDEREGDGSGRFTADPDLDDCREGHDLNLQ